VTTVVEVLLM